MIKSLRIHAATFGCLLAVAAQIFAADSEFPKGAEVRLKKDAPLLFKTDVARTGKAGESFVVLQHNVAAKKVFILAKDATGKEIALNVAEEALELASPTSKLANPPAAQAIPAMKSAAAPSGDTFDGMKAKFDARQDAVSLPKLEKDKFYFIGGGFGQIFYVAQAGDDFILAADVRHQPWAVLVFDDPKSIEGLQMQRGTTTGRAIGKFVNFKELPMADGSTQRFPVFSCVGVEIGRTFINTEKK